MSTTVIWCPECGGLGRVEQDWRGDDIVVCDAYERCGDRPALLAAADAALEAFLAEGDR